MNRLLILGAGTAGTMAANKLAKHLPDWQITMVDQHTTHYYQPGYLFIPFGGYTPKRSRSPRRSSFPTASS